jgi:hypothetical protein
MRALQSQSARNGVCAQWAVLKQRNRMAHWKQRKDRHKRKQQQYNTDKLFQSYEIEAMQVCIDGLHAQIKQQLNHTHNSRRIVQFDREDRLFNSSSWCCDHAWQALQVHARPVGSTHSELRPVAIDADHLLAAQELQAGGLGFALPGRAASRSYSLAPAPSGSSYLLQNARSGSDHGAIYEIRAPPCMHTRSSHER